VVIRLWPTVHVQELETAPSLTTKHSPSRQRPSFAGIEAEPARFGNLVTRHYEPLLLVAHKADVDHRGDDQRD
jgi:hypothetical protein